MLPAARATTTLRRTVPLRKCTQTGRDFREEIEERIRPDRNDRRNAQDENQKRQQQHAAP